MARLCGGSRPTGEAARHHVSFAHLGHTSLSPVSMQGVPQSGHRRGPSTAPWWLRSVNPMTIDLIADHETDSCGCWRSFAIDDKGLFGVAQADDSPAATLLLDSCDDGRAAGLSFAARIVRSHATGRTVHGLTVIVADEISLSEAGPKSRSERHACRDRERERPGARLQACTRGAAAHARPGCTASRWLARSAWLALKYLIVTR